VHKIYYTIVQIASCNLTNRRIYQYHFYRTTSMFFSIPFYLLLSWRVRTFRTDARARRSDGRRHDRARENWMARNTPVAFFSGRVNTARDVPIRTLMLYYSTTHYVYYIIILYALGQVMGKGSSSDRARTRTTIGGHAAAAAVASDASTSTVAAVAAAAVWWWWYSRGDANPAAVVPDV